MTMRLFITCLALGCGCGGPTPGEICTELQEQGEGICTERDERCVVVICGSQCGTLLPDTRPICENYADLPTALTTSDALFEGDGDCLDDCENQWGSIHTCQAASGEEVQAYDYLLVIP